MQRLPDTTNDLKLVDEELPNEGQLKSSNEHLVDTTDAPLKHTMIIPNLGMPSEKQNSQIFALAYNELDCNKQNTEKSVEQSETGQKSKEKTSGGDGSLSSGYSIVTISSVATSEPDPAPNGQLPLGRGRSVLDERWQHTALQVSVPFFIAGVGTIGAGLVLGSVEKWEVFATVSQLFILVPSLLGLKGNLDMCLASRLCTQANLGNMSGCREITKMVIGNLALVQIQAIVAAIIVSIFASAAYAAMNGIFIWNHALLVTASSLCTATSSCFVLGKFPPQIYAISLLDSFRVPAINYKSTDIECKCQNEDSERSRNPQYQTKMSEIGSLCSQLDGCPLKKLRM